MSEPSWLYKRLVSKGLDKALTNATPIPVNIGDPDERWVFFSDHHRGQRDGADDFLPAERGYHAALGYYVEHGYKLAVLGDVEELWENRIKPVMDTYSATLDLEKEFHDLGRYYRVRGNHDDEWKFPSQVKNILQDKLPGIEVMESYVLEFKNDEGELKKILLVHGHQGTLDSDTFGWISRYFVRYIWRPIQRLFNISPNTPAKSWSLRHKHDIALFNWVVNKEDLILIAGHTHHPIFDPRLQVEDKLKELDDAKQENDPEAIAKARARLEQVKVFENRQGFEMSQPCYFNTGCCCFSDGDITGIELDQGLIKLIKWSGTSSQPQILAKADLMKVFDRVSSTGATALALY